MKLDVNGCQNYCKENNITNYTELAKALGLSVLVIKLLEQGKQIGYDAVKDIYNKHGEQAVLQIINFEGETLNGFKSKYIQIGNRLY